MAQCDSCKLHYPFQQFLVDTWRSFTTTVIEIFSAWHFDALFPAHQNIITRTLNIHECHLSWNLPDGRLFFLKKAVEAEPAQICKQESELDPRKQSQYRSARSSREYKDQMRRMTQLCTYDQRTIKLAQRTFYQNQQLSSPSPKTYWCKANSYY